MKNWLTLGYLIVILFTEVDSNLCFGCRDTSSDEGKDDCQREVSEMHNLHSKLLVDYGNNSNAFLKDNAESVLVQDCSVYPNYSYCCIEELERLGTIQSYIRGCCNGKDFSVSISEVPKLKFAYPNNQTLCGYYENKGVVVCVTVCTGMFCNGPSFAESIHVFSIGILLLCHFICRIFAT